VQLISEIKLIFIVVFQIRKRKSGCQIAESKFARAKSGRQIVASKPALIEHVEINNLKVITGLTA